MVHLRRRDRAPRVAILTVVAMVATLGGTAPASAADLPRQWGDVTWTALSSETGDLDPPFGAGAEQTDAQILDIDKDGVNDIVVTNRSVAPAGVWYRRGADGWTRHVFEAGIVPLEAGGTHHDVDGDGDLDIVVGEGRQGNRIYWWENPYPIFDPGQAWTRHEIKNDGPNKHHDVIFGDVDGDGVDEFVYWNDEQTLRVAEIPADPAAGPWPATTIFSDPDKNEGLAIADIDLDGVDDIVGAGRWFEYGGPGNWTVHVIDPAMEFSRVAVDQIIPGGRPEVLFVVGDVSGDIDGTSYLTMYEWDGSTWVTTSLLGSELTHAGHSLDIVDFNRDGLLDVFNGEMTLGGNPDAAGRVFYGDGTGGFRLQEFSTGVEHHQSKVGDLDGDGDIDILGKPFTDDVPALHVWLNDEIDPGVLPLDQWVRHSVDSAQPWLSSHARWGDFDRDGRMDIASGGWIYESDGGDYAGAWTRRTIGAPLHNVAFVADFDGDGDLDLLGTDGQSQSPTHPGSTALFWGRNDGHGAFTILDNITPGVATDQSTAFVQGITSFDLGDDGTLDLAISWNYGEFGQSGIDLLTVPADPSTTTWPLTTISSFSEGEELGLDDIDGDGDLDLFQGSGWLRNDHPTWTRIESTTLIAHDTPYDDPDRVSMADVDGDGDLDAVIGLLFEAVSIPTDVVWLEHPADPTGEWPLHVIGSGIGGGFSMSVDDVDNDGDPDVVLGEHVGQHRMLLFENDGAGTAWTQHVIDDGTGVAIDHHDGAQLVDFENDGDLDIVSLGWHNQKVWLYENKALEPGDISDVAPPTAPGSLVATPYSSTRIDLVWTPSTDDRGIAHYRILRDGAEIATTAGVQFSDTGLAPASSHEYTVVGVDLSGNESPPSATATGATPTPDVTAPSAPPALVAHASAQRIDLSWGPASDDRGVVLYWVLRNGVSRALVAGDHTSFTDTGLTPDTTFVYNVIAFDADGNSSDMAGAAITVATLPAPTGLWAGYGFEDDGSAIADVSIYGNDGALRPSAVIGTEGHTGDALVVDGAAGYVDLGGLDIPTGEMTLMAWVNADDFGTYDARIISKSTGSGADDHYWMLSTISGQRLRVRLKTDDGNPTTTVIASGGALTAGTWHHVAATYDGATIRLYVDGEEVGSAAKTGAVAQDPTVPAYIGANPDRGGQVFDGRIDDVKIFGRALTPAELILEMNTPIAAAAPDTTAPTAPTALSGTAGGDTTVVLQWGAATDDRFVSGYVITRDGQSVATVPAGVLTYTDTGLAPDSTHSYTVIARDAAGNTSVPAGPISVATHPSDGEPPSAPGQPTVHAVSPTQASLSWTAATDNVGVAGYVIRRGGVEVAVVPASARTHLDSGLSPGATYEYVVVAFDAAANATPADPVSVTMPAAPGDAVAAYDLAPSGSVVPDRSGNGNDGALLGDAVASTAGRFDDAVEFFGAGAVGAVDLGGLDIVGDELTISAWINADDFGVADGRIISKAAGIAADDHLWMVSTIAGNRLRFRLKTDDGSPTTTLIAASGALDAGTWHFVAATYDGATMRLYLDGIEVGSASKNGLIARNAAVDVHIGANPGTDAKNFDGRIDELRIHARALSEAELVALAATPIGGAAPDLEPPTVPGSLAGVATGATAVELTWVASSDNVAVASYVVGRDGVELATVAAPASGYVDAAASPATTHTYTVTAVDSSGNTATAGPIEVVTPPAVDTEAPSVPGSVRLVTVTATTVELAWDASTDDVGVLVYGVFRDGVGIALLPVTARTFTDTAVTPGETYEYAVAAADAAGNVATSDPISVTTPDLVPGDLVVGYGFEDAGSTIADGSGNGLDAVLGAPAVLGATGRHGAALELDGTGGAADLRGLDIVGDQLTISAWIRADDFGVYDARIVSKSTGVAANDHLWMVSTFSNGRLRFRLRTDDGLATTTLIGSPGTLTAGTWHFVAATYDGAAMRLFVDGVEVGSVAKSGAVAVDPGVDVWIGNNPAADDQSFDGRIDEFRIHDRALEAADLVALALEPLG